MELITILLVAGFFFIMGGFVVGIIWYMQGVAKKSGIDTKTGIPGSTNTVELTRLMRDMQTQELVVEMDGKPFKTGNELSPAQLRRLSFTSNVLVKWLADVTPAPDSVEEPSAVTTGTAPLETIPTPVEIASPESRPEYTSPFTQESEQEVKPVSTDLPDVVGGLLNPSPQPAATFKSIAMQINDILQTQIAGTELESRGITLTDGPNHGVMVTMDGEKYNGVMEVPDEAVRNAIRAAVQEWETKK
jgi:hypothetical protein